MARQVPGRHLRQGFLDQRIHDPLDRPAFDPGRAAPAQYRLQVHRPGFFLENGTEADNKFYSNLGIFARAAVNNPQNPRKVPGILAADAWSGSDNQTRPSRPTPFPSATDYQHPTVFWISNGWNDFVGNMAAGAGACGAAYWFVSTQNNDMPGRADLEPIRGSAREMKWTGYASLQNTPTTTGIDAAEDPSSAITPPRR